MENFIENRKILYVDDESELLNAFADLLHKENFEVCTLQDSKAIGETLDKDGPFAIVLSDQRMPGYDGVKVLELTNMVFSGPTGDRDSSAIRADHTVWTWGRNWNGQLGIGSANSNLYTLPVPVPHFGNGYVTMVQTPDWHSMALESDGTLWEWGSNDHGQLASGTTNEAWSPQLVSTWPDEAPPTPVRINYTGVRKQSGAFQFGFANTPGTQFTVVTATNMQVPIAKWTPVGGVTEVSPGQFQFNDYQAGNPLRFYCVRSP